MLHSTPDLHQVMQHPSAVFPPRRTTISVRTAAKRAKVNEQTIRNWARARFFLSSQPGPKCHIRIDEASFEECRGRLYGGME